MNRVCSIFSQILQFIPRLAFEAKVREHKAERHARGFSSWTQLIALLSANSDMRRACAKSRAVWPPAKGNCGMWG